MRGSEFVRAFQNKGLPAWEAAALELARQGELTPWPFVELDLVDDAGNTATLSVQSDVLAIGTLEDHVRLPLTPSSAQSILNLTGALLPTPLLVYRIWQAAPFKITPLEMIPTATLTQFAQHDALIDEALEVQGWTPGARVGGVKKHVVVSDLMKPGKVVIFGWYRKSPPFPDVFTDRQPMGTPGRQPIQPLSNLHSDGYVDYSHGIQAVGPTCVVNGEPMATVDLYQHPVLSRLVSHEGRISVPRYPSPVAPATNLAARVSDEALGKMTVRIVPDVPGMSEMGYSLITGRAS